MNVLAPRLFILMLLIMFAGCAPRMVTITRMEWKPYTSDDSKQEKDGVTVELGRPVVPNPRMTNEIPAEFWVVVQACDSAGNLLRNQQGPVNQTISVAINKQIWQPISITNHTDHVLRFNYVAIRLFDPSGTQLEPMTKDDVAARLMIARPCASSRNAVNQIRSLKIFDRNMEIVPRTTSTFWVPFTAPSTEMPGVWRYSIYEVPVVVDQAGRTVRATQFEIRTVATKMLDTYREEPLKPPVLIRSEEDPSSKMRMEPAPGAAPPPPTSIRPPIPPTTPLPPPTTQPPSAAPPPVSPPQMSAIPPRQEPAPPPKAEDPSVLFVSVSSANMREAGDAKAKIIRTLPKGTRLTVIGKTNQWYRVRLDNGTEGWVAESVTSTQSK